MVAGILLSGGILVSTSESSVSAAEVVAAETVKLREKRCSKCTIGEVKEVVRVKNLRVWVTILGLFL